MGDWCGSDVFFALKRHSYSLSRRWKRTPYKELRGVCRKQYSSISETKSKFVVLFPSGSDQNCNRIHFWSAEHRMGCNDHRTYSVLSIDKSNRLRPSSFLRFAFFSSTTKMQIAMKWRCFVVINPTPLVVLACICIFRCSCRLSSTNSNGVWHFTRSALFWFGIHITHSAFLRNVLAHTRQTPSP